MAFVSDKFRVVFIHVPKTGGTSITQALARAHDSDLKRDLGYYQHNGVGQDIDGPFKPNGIHVHDPWPVIVEKYPAAKDYLPIAVVRNPWARIYSYYWHKRRRKDLDLPKNPATQQPYALRELVRVSNVWLLQPQVWWLPEHAHVVLFEDMPTSLQQFSGRLPDVPIPRLNTNPSENADYHKAYDPYARGLVEAYYRHEIERFGFEF